jgi:hypothetical protein
MNGSEIDLQSITGVYCRHPLELPPLDSSDAVADYSHSESLATLRGTLLAIPAARWINYPWYENSADGKIWPLKIAKQVGLSVPAFVVTNDLAQLDRWRSRYGDDLIIKPITDTSIAKQRAEFIDVPDYSTFSAPYTAKFDRSALNSDNIDSTPFLVQERIHKVCERRVVVIDDTLFVTETTADPSASVDIRLKSDRIERPSSLVDADKIAVLALRRRLNLRSMTLDFAVDVAETSWLLDVNPSGNWLWQEQQLCLGIPAAIGAALIADTGRS